MTQQLPEISLLPVELCNQIAAGEVVERPASVVKELVENSLDAGAGQVDVCLENGGQSLISVQDDGQGIAPNQLELAITRHATSKIRGMDDLENIASYGFRGEALPSIASVSRFRIVSRWQGLSKGELAAHCLEVEHGRNISKSLASLPQGTLVEVRDLFGSTPARLKFLKSPATELKKAQYWLARLALANREAGFSLKAGDREIFRFLKGEDLQTRLEKIWPAELVNELIAFDGDLHGIRLYGLTSPAHLSHSRAERMLFYVNGRAVNDKRLISAVRESYRGRLISRDYPQTVLFIEINPAEIDVNVHPAKTEVRFRNEGALFSAIAGAIGQTFRNMGANNSPAFSSAQATTFAFEQGRATFWKEPELPPIIEREKSSAKDEGSWQVYWNEERETAPAETDLNETCTPFAGAWPDEAPSFEGSGPELGVADKARLNAQTAWGDMEYLGQFANTYLLLRDRSLALVLVDQHAAHERVIFQRLLKGAGEGAKNLIVPLELRLDEERQASLEKVLPVLTRLGYNCYRDGKKLLVKTIPAVLSRAEAREILEESLAAKNCDANRIYASLACRAAVKAGQELGPDEALELLRQWGSTPMAEFCPHGRPCVLRWTAPDLEKLFKRR